MKKPLDKIFLEQYSLKKDSKSDQYFNTTYNLKEEIKTNNLLLFRLDTEIYSLALDSISHDEKKDKITKYYKERAEDRLFTNNDIAQIFYYQIKKLYNRFTLQNINKMFFIRKKPKLSTLQLLQEYIKKNNIFYLFSKDKDNSISQKLFRIFILNNIVVFIFITTNKFIIKIDNFIGYINDIFYEYKFKSSQCYDLHKYNNKYNIIKRLLLDFFNEYENENTIGNISFIQIIKSFIKYTFLQWKKNYGIILTMILIISLPQYLQYNFIYFIIFKSIIFQVYDTLVKDLNIKSKLSTEDNQVMNKGIQQYNFHVLKYNDNDNKNKKIKLNSNECYNIFEIQTKDIVYWQSSYVQVY